MSTQTMTLREYQSLCERLRDIETIETDGLLIMRGYAAGQGHVLALHPFASSCVTIVWPDEAPSSAHAMIRFFAPRNPFG